MIKAIGRRLAERAELLDVHVDEDHNRSVFTLVGGEDELVEALLAGIACARTRIDLREHRGAHPRIGAADVVPIVPIRPDDADRARAAALELGRRIGEELGLPRLPLRGPRSRPRPGVFQARRAQTSCSGGSTPASSCPTSARSRSIRGAGGVIVGARRPLIAFNVNLVGADVEVAREIARVVRERDGGFPGVRALGLELPRAGRAQVSMNVEDWEASALHDIVAAIEREAAARGVEVAGSELVGLMPAERPSPPPARTCGSTGFDASRVLELRLLDR